MESNITVLSVTVLALLMGIPSSFRIWSMDHIKFIGMSILDTFDFLSNSVLMPIAAFFTCVFVGYVIKPKTIIDEVKESDGTFKSEKLFTIMIKWIAPIFLIAILASSVANAMGWFVI